MSQPYRSPAPATLTRPAPYGQHPHARPAAPGRPPAGARLQPGAGPVAQRPMAQRPMAQRPMGQGPTVERPAPRAAVTFLTVAEVAAIMRVSKMTVYRLVHGGELSAVRVGRSFRVPEPAVRSYLSEARTDVA